MALVLTSSCAVPIKEETYYTDVSPDGAIVTHLFSTDSSRIGQSAWDSIRVGMTCTTATGIADMKAELEQLCTKIKCSEVDATTIIKFFARIEKAQKESTHE